MAADGNVEGAQPAREVSYSYVLMVQHLIEWCILLCMERDQCVRSLAKYARVKPVITITVWNELEKNNPDFFAEYARKKGHQQARSFECMLEDATARLCAANLREAAVAFESSPVEVGAFGESQRVSCW